MSDSIKLGQVHEYSNEYDPKLLETIDRAQQRQDAYFDPLPLTGLDLWTAYEFSWLNTKGVPQVAIAEIAIPCESPYTVESKSLKYYLNAFCQKSFADVEAVQVLVAHDLSRLLKHPVGVSLRALEAQSSVAYSSMDNALCIDSQDVSIDTAGYKYSAKVLRRLERDVSDEILYSNLFRSSCPVTGQPDWASVYIQYSGQKICPDSLLRYVISFREHQAFHESCIETIFKDLALCYAHRQLTVWARFTRRGGIDINPVRSTHSNALERLPCIAQRTVRQ